MLCTKEYSTSQLHLNEQRLPAGRGKGLSVLECHSVLHTDEHPLLFHY